MNCNQPDPLTRLGHYAAALTCIEDSEHFLSRAVLAQRTAGALVS